MNADELICRARELVAQAIIVPAEKLSEESEIYSLPEWDSLGQLQIVQLFESLGFGEVDNARMFNRLTSVKSIASLLCAYEAQKIEIQNEENANLIPASLYKPDNPVACLLLVHGITADRHEWGFFDLLSLIALQRQMLVLAIDYQGHGESRTPIDQISLFSVVKEIESAYDYMRSDNPGIPSMILGNSFGGGVSLLVGQKRDTNLICMSCAVTSYISDIARVNPKYHSETDSTHVSYSTLRLPTDILDEMATIDAELDAASPKCPILFFHGGRDSDVPCEEAREFSNHFSNVRFREFTDMDHSYTAPIEEKQRDERTVRFREQAAAGIVTDIYQYV